MWAYIVEADWRRFALNQDKGSNPISLGSASIRVYWIPKSNIGYIEWGEQNNRSTEYLRGDTNNRILPWSKRTWKKGQNSKRLENGLVYYIVIIFLEYFVNRMLKKAAYLCSRILLFVLFEYYDKVCYVLLLSIIHTFTVILGHYLNETFIWVRRFQIR